MSNFRDEKFGDQNFCEEKWRMRKEPDFEKLEEILNAQSQEMRIMADCTEEGIRSMEAFSEIGREASRTIKKARSAGRTVAMLGPRGLLLSHALKTIADKPNFLAEDISKTEPAFDKNLTREDFPSRQAWRAYCRELAKAHSKGK